MILTIGYEGRDIDEFISRLKDFGVTRLIDVREKPQSRKKGFSKSALGEWTESEGIEYVHIREVGAPSEIRNKLKASANYDYFFRAYARHLKQQPEAIATIHHHVTSGVNCIMCFERNPLECHRLKLAETIKEYDSNGLKIKHI